MKEFIGVEIIHDMRQTIETWQRGCEAQINLLMKCNQDLETRIKELENAYEADSFVARDIIFDGARQTEKIFSLHARLSELEEWTRKDEDKIYERMNDQSKRIDCLEVMFQELSIRTRLMDSKKPHKCPVCEGTTYCSEGMCCVPCDGTGMVWG